MTNPTNTVSRTRTRLLAAVASVAIAGAIGFGAVTTGTLPVLADAVRVEAPQVPSFADVVEKVSPAVVSVRVQEKVQPASDSGADLYQFQTPPGFDNLPDDHPLKEPGYVPLDGFWRKRGYAPIEGLIAYFKWKDIDQDEETAKPMQFWGKALR